MPQVHEQQYIADPILDSFRKRVTAEIIESLFQCTTITGPSLLSEHIRQIVRNSPACAANFESILFRCQQDGVTVGRRSAFRAGCCLGLLMAEGIPRPNFVDVAFVNLKHQQEQEREAVAVAEPA